MPHPMDSFGYRAKLGELAKVTDIRNLRNFTTQDFKFVQHTIQNIAIELYSHEKVTRFWIKNTKDGHNTILWFINRVDMEKPTNMAESLRAIVKRPTNPDPMGAWRCVKSGAEVDELQLSSRMIPVKLVPLAEFEDLWYMTVAKVKELYEDLSIRCKNGFISLTHELHHRGADAHSTGCVTAHDMSNILVNYWCVITDVNLMATLDYAIRLEKFQTLLRDKFFPGRDMLSLRACEKRDLRDKLAKRGWTAQEAFSTVKGLKMDVNNMSTAMIAASIYEKLHPVIEKEKEMAEQREQSKLEKRAFFGPQAEALNAAKSEAVKMFDPKGSECLCAEPCYCKSHCNVDPLSCFCRHDSIPAQIKRLKTLERVIRKLGPEYEGLEDEPEEEYLFGAPNNDVAQLLIAGAALKNPKISEAAHNIVKAHKANEVYVQEAWAQELSQKFRQNAIDAEAAKGAEKEPLLKPVRYNPATATPVKEADEKKEKDKYPLEFYIPVAERVAGKAANDTEVASNKSSLDKGVQCSPAEMAPPRKLMGPPTPPKDKKFLSNVGRLSDPFTEVESYPTRRAPSAFTLNARNHALNNGLQTFEDNGESRSTSSRHAPATIPAPDLSRAQQQTRRAQQAFANPPVTSGGHVSHSHASSGAMNGIGTYVGGYQVNETEAFTALPSYEEHIRASGERPRTGGSAMVSNGSSDESGPSPKQKSGAPKKRIQEAARGWKQKILRRND